MWLFVLETLRCWTGLHQARRAKPSEWTICHCSTNPRPHHTNICTASTHGCRSGDTPPLSVSPFEQHETKWHTTQTLIDQMPGSTAQRALIASGLSATTAHIFLICYFLPLSDSTQAQQASLSLVLRVVVSR